MWASPGTKPVRLCMKATYVYSGVISLIKADRQIKTKERQLNMA